jgi:phage protein D
MSTPNAASRYAPEFQVRLNGQPAPAALRIAIVSLTYQTGLEGADRVEITLVNENLHWLDNPLLRLDDELSIAIGYAPDPLRQMFVGEIVALSPTFPSSGAPMLTVTAQDRRHRMQKGNKVRWFAIATKCFGNFPIPDVAVAGMVSVQDGLIPIVDPFGALLSIVFGETQAFINLSDPDSRQKMIRKQSNESDYDFLRRICAENGWEMVMEHQGSLGGRQLHFKTLVDNLHAELSLRYGASLVEFSPRVSNVGQVARFAMSFWESHSNLEFTVTVGWDWDRNALMLEIVPGFGVQGLSAENDINKNPVMILNEPLNALTAPRVLASKLLAKLNNRLTGSGRCIGDPRIQAGTVIRIEGVGQQFGGLYRVTSATHTINGSGYQTSFELRKEVWFGSVPLLEQRAVRVDTFGQTLRMGRP